MYCCNIRHSDRSKNQQSHQQLVEQCKNVADLIPKVVQGIRGCMVKPDSFSSQANLLNACEDFLGPATRLASLAKASVPTVHNQSQTSHLNNSSKQLTQALIDLRACLTRKIYTFVMFSFMTKEEFFFYRLKIMWFNSTLMLNQLLNQLKCLKKNSSTSTTSKRWTFKS